MVVVGTLQDDFRFPWFDGWNERGHIIVEQVLKGSLKPGTHLSFAWEWDFRQGWCLTRPDWRGAVGKRGIWFLRRDGNRYRAPELFSGFRPITHLPKLREELTLVNSLCRTQWTAVALSRTWRRVQLD